MSIIHTGDLLDKKAPSLQALDFFLNLQKKIHAVGGFVNLLAGNHEQEIWIKISNGETYGLPKHSLDLLCDLIESLDLFYVEGPVLFIHSYPTVEFLRALIHYKEVTGNHLNSFNTDHYKKAFKSVEALNQYSYIKGCSNENYLLYDPKSIESYYRKNGSEITTLLNALEIDCIVHGHRPQSSGRQVDHEFSKWIPEIRIIGNDTKVKLQGIGATLLRMDIGRAVQIIFINQKTANKKNLKNIRNLLRISAPGPARLYQQEIDSQQCRKLQDKMDTMSLEYQNQRLQADYELQEQRTSNLLLQEELRERDELYQKTQENLKSIEATNLQLENELLNRDEQQQPLVKELPVSEISSLPLENVQQQNKKNLITEQALEALELSKTKLQQKLEKNNHTRKQAVDYLRICHDTSQRIDHELKQCENNKLEAEKDYFSSLKNEQTLKQKLEHQLEKSTRVGNIYAAIISFILIGMSVFYLI